MTATHTIQGEAIILRPATLNDRLPVYQWLAKSDLTSLMLGPPTFHDHPVPSWEEFQDDYKEYFFDGSAPYRGRSFIIEYNDEAVGHVNYSDIQLDENPTELDIWLSEKRNTSKGYGTDALLTLCEYLHDHMGCQKFLLAPSKRNIWAVKAYLKAGFQPSDERPDGFVPDYH
ncbi:MAG TPA: GNAT family protein, partial [Chitinophagaceae bacterium]